MKGGRHLKTADRSSAAMGNPVAHIADCHSMSLRVVPSGLASITPTTLRSLQKVVRSTMTAA
jgi:hypothetical protein